MPELKLPDRLRDVEMPKSVTDASKSVSDVSKSVSDVVADRLSRVDLSGLELPRMDIRAPKVDVRVRDIRRPKMQDVVPQRSGPSPLPFLLLGILGGLFIGIWAATSEMFGPTIRSAVDDMGDRIQGLMPPARDQARRMQSTFEQTLASAGQQAETDYERTAASVSTPGTSIGGSDTTTGEAATGTVGSMESGTASGTPDPYGTSGSSY